MIGIIDYGMGNLHSVENAFRHLGHETIISQDPQVLAQCDKLVLPGVGAFADMVVNLKEKELFDFIKVQVGQGKPLLGICLGMQALFERSYEQGEHEGLGFLNGEVVLMEDPQVRIPQIGWNKLNWQKNHALSSLKIADKPVWFYFDHSYYADQMNPDHLAAWAEHGKYRIPAIVVRDNVLGIQCHPEKSASEGLAFLDYFAKEFPC